jgi:hypothetical protein
MTWQRGLEVIDRLLMDRELERVTPNLPVAERLLTDASAHIASGGLIASRDPAGAYQLGYDAARKAAIALLAAQGLRATSRGGHVAVQEAVQAQFGGPGGSSGVQRVRPPAPSPQRERVSRARVADDHARRRR